MIEVEIQDVLYMFWFQMFKFLIRTHMFAIEMNSIKRILPEGSIICVMIAPKQMNKKNPIFHQIGWKLF